MVILDTRMVGNICLVASVGNPASLECFIVRIWRFLCVTELLLYSELPYFSIDNAHPKLFDIPFDV